MCLHHVPDLRATWTFLRGTPTLLPFPWVMILHPDPTPPSPHRLARPANLITADWSTTEPASPPPQATECSERASLASYQDIHVSFPPKTLNFSCRVKTPKEILLLGPRLGAWLHGRGSYLGLICKASFLPPTPSLPHHQSLPEGVDSFVQVDQGLQKQRRPGGAGSSLTPGSGTH